MHPSPPRGRRAAASAAVVIEDDDVDGDEDADGEDDQDNVEMEESDDGPYCYCRKGSYGEVSDWPSKATRRDTGGGRNEAASRGTRPRVRQCDVHARPG